MLTDAYQFVFVIKIFQSEFALQIKQSFNLNAEGFKISNFQTLKLKIPLLIQMYPSSKTTNTMRTTNLQFQLIPRTIGVYFEPSSDSSGSRFHFDRTGHLNSFWLTKAWPTLLEVTEYYSFSFFLCWVIVRNQQLSTSLGQNKNDDIEFSGLYYVTYTIFGKKEPPDEMTQSLSACVVKRSGKERAVWRVS